MIDVQCVVVGVTAVVIPVYLGAGLNTSLLDWRGLGRGHTPTVSSVLLITGSGLDWIGRGLTPDARLIPEKDAVDLLELWKNNMYILWDWINKNLGNVTGKWFKYP